MTKPATCNAQYESRTRDENKARELHPSDCGAIVLDTFMAMAQDDRRAVWALASDADRRGLALQIIRRKNHGPDEATIQIYLGQLEQRFGTDQLLPATAEILAAAKEYADTARTFGDLAGAAQLGRVRQNLLNGARLTWHLGDLLIQSVNNPGSVYTTSQRGCTCPNGAAGKQTCWHLALFELLVTIAEDRAAARDMLADAAAYRAEQEQDEDGGDDPDDGVGGPPAIERFAAHAAATPSAPASTLAELGQRLALARRHYLLAA
jgi:hypothetical protein